MKKIAAVMLAVLMAMSFAAMPLSASASVLKADNNTKLDYTEGEAIVVFNSDSDKRTLNASGISDMFGKKVQLKNLYSFSDITGSGKSDLNVAVLKSSKLSTKQLIRKAKKSKNVKYAFPNTKKHITSITNDSFSDYQWALDNQGQNGGTAGLDVNAEKVWAKAAKSDKEQIVAVVDTGIDYNSAEFKGKLWVNKHGSRLLGKYGYDFTGEIKDHSPLDNNGHGTHCAGIITAASDNKKGISGINQTNTKIMALKWLTADGYGDTEGVLAAYEYINRAIELGENVVAISNSWGGMGEKEELAVFEEIFDQFGEAGVISLVAAGNEAQDITQPQKEEFLGIVFEEEYYVIPAACNSNYQLTVAATNEKDELADFSNYGKGLTDVAAPGVDILSTVSYNCFNPTIYTANRRSKLVASLQEYNSTLKAGDFGYPEIKAPKQDFFSVEISDKVTVGQSDRYFGNTKGKSLSLKLTEEATEEKPALYCFAIPFSIADENKNYSISMMSSGVKNSYAMVFDVPAEWDLEKKFDDIFNTDAVAEVGGSATGNYWSHSFFDVDVTATNYTKAKDRQLVFIMEAYAKDTEFNLDDLAISKQDVKADDFLKYDFYCGTSMATPYVAGAVALLHNAYPKATPLDIINMIKNTGRISASLQGKTDNARVLSLDNLAVTPPMIADVAYNSKGNIEITGSFKGTTSVMINGKEVKPARSKSHKIVIKDKKYNTKKITVQVTNKNGSDKATALVSKKKLIPLSSEVMSAPEGVTGNDFFLPAGDKSYYVSEYGFIGKITKDKEAGAYLYNMLDYQLDPTVLFDVSAVDEVMYNITSAAYANGSIFFVAVRPIYATSTGTVIGYDNAFGKFTLYTGETTKLAEVPDNALFGSSLGIYNGAIYLAGGYDSSTGKYSDKVYRYLAKKSKFVKTKATLPKGRAYTRFVQYGNKLVGVYGAEEDGKLPAIITFDGKQWKASKVSVKTEDYSELKDEMGNTVKLYQGSFGFAKKGLLLNGVYCYGYGDTYYYDVKNDKLIKSKYSSRNSLSDPKVYGTTLPGKFIAFPAADTVLDIDDIEDYRLLGGVSYDDEDYVDDGEYDDYSDFDEGYGPTVYVLDIGNGYAKVNTSAVKNATVVTKLKKNYAYGDTISITLAPKEGYKIASISQGKKVKSKNSTSAKLLLNTKTVKVTAKVVKEK